MVQFLWVSQKVRGSKNINANTYIYIIYMHIVSAQPRGMCFCKPHKQETVLSALRKTWKKDRFVFHESV